MSSHISFIPRLLVALLSGIVLISTSILIAPTATSANTPPLVPFEQLKDGDIARDVNGIDVYILKRAPSGALYKRLILNPEIFNSYGHLKWENVKLVHIFTLDKFLTSPFIQEVHPDGTPVNDTIYYTVADGDVGMKRIVSVTRDRLRTLGFPYEAIFKVNHIEAGPSFYKTGAPVYEADIRNILSGQTGYFGLTQPSTPMTTTTTSTDTRVRVTRTHTSNDSSGYISFPSGARISPGDLAKTSGYFLDSSEFRQAGRDAKGKRLYITGIAGDNDQDDALILCDKLSYGECSATTYEVRIKGVRWEVRRDIKPGKKMTALCTGGWETYTRYSIRRVQVLGCTIQGGEATYATEASFYSNIPDIYTIVKEIQGSPKNVTNLQQYNEWCKTVFPHLPIWTEYLSNAEVLAVIKAIYATHTSTNVSSEIFTYHQSIGNYLDYVVFRLRALDGKEKFDISAFLDLITNDEGVRHVERIVQIFGSLDDALTASQLQKIPNCINLKYFQEINTHFTNSLEKLTDVSIVEKAMGIYYVNNKKYPKPSYYADAYQCKAGNASGGLKDTVERYIDERRKIQWGNIIYAVDDINNPQTYVLGIKGIDRAHPHLTTDLDVSNKGERAGYTIIEGGQYFNCDCGNPIISKDNVYCESNKNYIYGRSKQVTRI